MTRQIVIDEDHFNTVTIKLDQARKLAEMSALYQDVNVECTKLRQNAAFLIQEMLDSAHDLLVEHGALRQGA